MVFGHGCGDRSRSRATSAQSGRIPTHEPERRRRLSLLAARAAPPASSRPFPQPGPSPRSPSSISFLRSRRIVCPLLLGRRIRGLTLMGLGTRAVPFRLILKYRRYHRAIDSTAGAHVSSTLSRKRRSDWDYLPPMKKLSSTILPFWTV